ncbi:MAG: AAA family ATPase [Deltaproteobacteria bacterium]|nr:AAA family ATPase [Deltaproteobacteria bacterium]
MPRTYELQLEDYWRIVKRRRVIVIATFVLITGAIFIHSAQTVPTYEAVTTIKIESQPGLAEKETYWYSDFIETQMEVIHSHEVGMEAATHAGLIKEGMSKEEKDAVIGPFMGVTTTKRGRTNIIDILATSSSPQEVAQIVNMVARGYQSWSKKDLNEQARTVREFLEKQLQETGDKLKDNEEALRLFKEESPLGASISSYNDRLVDLELELSTKLEEYTYQHPDVVELMAKIENLKARIGRYPELELEYNRLSREVTTLQGIYAGLKTKYEDAKTEEAKNVSGITILNIASVPEAPIAPDVARSTMVGGLIALILGILLAFVKENVDTSISTIEEVEDFLQIPVLGVIPEMVREENPEKKWERLKQYFSLISPRLFRRSSTRDVTDIQEVRKMVMLSGETHHFAPVEGYKTLRTNLLFAMGDKKGQVIEITSSGSREGKSLTSLNLSLTLAQNGHKTCLISADLRRESICRILGINKDPGLVDVLTKDMPWQEAIRSTTDFLLGEINPDRFMQTMGIDNFFLLPSGRLPINPAEVLATKSLDKLLHELRAHFDFVIVDTPPILPVADPSEIASRVDGVIIVYQVGRTARGALKRAKMQLANTGAKVLGVVLNNIKAAEMRMAPTYYYYYKEYYGPDEKLLRERIKRKREEKHWWDRFLPGAFKQESKKIPPPAP